MSIISIPFIFSAGAVIVASQHNSCFSTIYSDYSGNIDNTNIVTNAGIIASKLDLTSPGAIGSTAANTGKFTTLQATGATTLSSTLNLGSTHQGDVLYDNGTSIVRLTPGTNLQFLQTQGTNANPQWATPKSYLSLISTTAVSATTSSGNITIVSSNYYKVILIALNATASANTINIQFNADGGSNYSSGYSGRGSSAAIGAGSAASGSIVPFTSVLGSQTFMMEFTLSPDQGNANAELINGFASGGMTTGGNGSCSNFGGIYTGSSSIVSFVVSGTQNWTGTIYTYQIALS